MAWEIVHGEPHPLLRPHVRRGYEAYELALGAPARRLEVPHAGIVLIVAFGPPVSVDGARLTSFVAGLHDRPAVVCDDGRQAGIQANLTPLGARMLLGLPMGELANRSVALEDVVSADLPERLAGLPDWPARFAALDEWLLKRLRAALAPRPDVAYAWSRLQQPGGPPSIGALCRELGCSRRHLATRFREEVGLAPKAFARVLRFERAAALLEQGVPAARVAVACGYADQPHMAREFRALAGRPPAAYLAAVTDVQDGVGVAA